MAITNRMGQYLVDPRTLSYEDQQRYHEQAIRAAHQDQYQRHLQAAYGNSSGIGETPAKPPPKQEEPNKVLLLLPPVA